MIHPRICWYPVLPAWVYKIPCSKWFLGGIICVRTYRPQVLEYCHAGMILELWAIQENEYKTQRERTNRTCYHWIYSKIWVSSRLMWWNGHVSNRVPCPLRYREISWASDLCVLVLLVYSATHCVFGPSHQSMPKDQKIKLHRLHSCGHWFVRPCAPDFAKVLSLFKSNIIWPVVSVHPSNLVP